MNLPQQFDEELANLGSGGAVTMSVEMPPRRLTCDLAERNTLAVALQLLRLTTSELAAADGARLKELGAKLSSRLTYLMEPISPIEVDAEGCVVQLRSNPPQRDDDAHTYYELLLRRGGEIRLTRYRKERGNSRQPIAATLTREVLSRLVADMCAVLE